MLTIDPAALGALAVHLAKSDAAHQAVSEAVDALEVAAAKANNEPARLVCVEALRGAVDERDEALLDLEDAVRVALYGPEEDDDED